MSLALAMVVSSTAPLLLLDGHCKVIAASASFCRTFDLAPGNVTGRQIFALGQGEWGSPQLRSLVSATLSGDAQIDAYEMNLERDGQAARCLVVSVQKLVYGKHDPVRLLMSIADVTEARQSSKRVKDLVREHELLIQEVRHRIANSLQIIASVMMQNARRAQSDETRGHLRDAQQRVMSVAELQQQLAATTLGTVSLRAYLTKLSETISASMIAHPEELSIVVDVEDVTIDAAVSVSIGLIVTELAINALKHAFPDEQGGKITVSYRSKGSGWTLSVRDNGVGMPPVKSAAMAGLGTTIIQALAKQLGAQVKLEDVEVGVCVSIVHPGASPTSSPGFQSRNQRSDRTKKADAVASASVCSPIMSEP